MIKIPLSKIPNQSFSIGFNDVNYDVVVKTVNDITLLDIAGDNGTKIHGVKCFPNRLLFNYGYLTPKINLVFFSESDEYPNFKNFDDTCKLYMLTEDEAKQYV